MLPLQGMPHPERFTIGGPPEFSIALSSSPEFVEQMVRRYQEPSGQETAFLLGVFVTVTAYAHTYAIRILNHTCAKRLIPFLPILVEALERQACRLHLIEERWRQLLSIQMEHCTAHFFLCCFLT